MVGGDCKEVTDVNDIAEDTKKNKINIQISKAFAGDLRRFRSPPPLSNTSFSLIVKTSLNLKLCIRFGQFYSNNLI